MTEKTYILKPIVREIRIRKGIKNFEFAKLIGISWNRYSAIELGNRRATISLVKKISSELGIDFKDAVFGDGVLNDRRFNGFYGKKSKRNA